MAMPPEEEPAALWAKASMARYVQSRTANFRSDVMVWGGGGGCGDGWVGGWVGRGVVVLVVCGGMELFA